MRQFIIAVSILILAVSCRQEPQGQIASIAETKAPEGGRTAVFTTAGGPKYEFKQEGERIEVAYNGGKLVGEPRDSGKRKYKLDGGPVIYEVKPGDSGFKLRTPDGKLRWKVKISPEKIKISDNEENQNPFELKRRENGELKVVAPGEKEIGRITGGAGQGVMLIDSIPEVERYILMAELMARKL
jgi:hypothetical protein